jgi:hypothetical protein
MPRVTVAEENRVGEREDKFPQLKLKLDERRRIWLPPEGGKHQPWREWVHVIKAPVIKDGVAQKETRQRQDGSSFETYATTFIGSPLCLGREDILMEHGVDPGNCPDCEAAEALGRATFKPQVRYASEIIAYATKQGGWELAAPFSASLLIWSYPAGRYGKLDDLRKAEARDVSQFDLRLGPCEKPENMQKYDIQALGSQPCAWTLSEQVKTYVLELWSTAGNRPTEDQLVAACGRKTERAYMLEDIKRATQLWNMAEAAGSGGAPGTLGAEFSGGQPADLGAGLSGLLNSAQAQPAAPAVAAQAGGSFEDLLGGAAPAPAVAPAVPAVSEVATGQPQPAPPIAAAPPPQVASVPVPPAPAVPSVAAPDIFAQAAQAAPAQPAGETVSFESLLGG